MAKNLQAYKLGVNIEANAAKALGVLRDVDRQAGKTAGTLAAVARVGKDVGTGLSVGLTAPLTGLGVASIRAATQMDSLTRGLRAVSGSSEEANRQLARLKEVAKLPGLGFAEAVQGSINLQAAGISADLAERSLKAFGNALATVGKGKSELDGVILALGQIESKGKVSAEEINQLAERVPQIRKAIVAAFGTADTEVIQKAKITSRQFTEAVVRELERLPQATAGAQTTFENLSDSYQQSLAKIGNAGLRILVPALERVTPLVEDLGNRFAALNPETQKAAIYFGTATAALGPLAYGTSTAITGVTNLASGVRAVTTSISASGGLLAALGSLNPVLLAVSGAAIAGGVIWYEYSRRTREAADAIEAAVQRSQRARAQMGNTVTLADGSTVNVLPDRETTVDASKWNLPTIKGQATDIGFVPLNPDGSRPGAPTPPKIDLSKQGKGKGKTGGNAAKEAARELRDVQEAELQIARDGLASRLRIEQDGLERRARTVQDAYAAGLLTTREYYQRTAQIAQAGVEAELQAIRDKRASVSLERARAKPGSADAVRLKGEIYQLDTEQILKLSEGLRLAADNLREFKREFSDLADVDLSQQVQAVEVVPELVRRARERNAELAATAGQGELVDAEFQRDRERIQTNVVKGVLSEAAAKREVLSLEAQYRDAMIPILEAKRELAGLDAAAVAALDAQIEKLKQLGQAQLANKTRKPLFADRTIAATDADGEELAAANASQSAAAGLKAAADEAKSLGTGAFKQLGSGIGSIVQDFVLLGETGPAALKKITAQVLASLSAEATVKSLYYLAEGFASLFTNPAKASGYFTAAAIMGGVAVAAGVGGRALSPKSDKGQISDEQRRQAAIKNVSSESYAGNRFERRENGGSVLAGNAYLIGERRPEVVEFPLNGRIYPSTDDYARKRQQADQLRNLAASHSTETFMGRALHNALEKLEAQLARLEATSGDDLFLRVMDRNPRAVGRATVSALDQDDQLSSRLGRRIAA